MWGSAIAAPKDKDEDERDKRRSWETKAKVDENGEREKMKVTGQRKGRKGGKNDRKRGGGEGRPS